MIAVRVDDLTAQWDGRQWTSADESLTELLNSVATLAMGYLPQAVNVQTMMVEAVGESGWEIIKADDESAEPGIIY